MVSAKCLSRCLFVLYWFYTVVARGSMFLRFIGRRATTALIASHVVARSSPSHMAFGGYSPTLATRRWHSDGGDEVDEDDEGESAGDQEEWSKQGMGDHIIPDPLPEGVEPLSRDDSDYINVELRTMLVGKADVPIGSVPAHMSERSRDLLAKIGGLGLFLDTYGKKMFAKVLHSSGTTLVMNRHYAPNSFLQKVIEVTKLREEGSGVAISHIMPKVSVSLRQYMNLKSSRLPNCLRSHPELFTVSEDRRLVSLTGSKFRFPVSSQKPLSQDYDQLLSSGSHAIHLSGYNDRLKHGIMTTTQGKGMIYETRKDITPALNSLLFSALPTTCFVPLSEVVKRLPSDFLSSLCGSSFKEDDPHSSLMERFSSLPADIVDIRVLGDSPDQIFIRLVGDRMFYSVDSDGGEDRFSDYNVNHLGQEIAEAFRAAGCEETTIDALPSILSSEILDQFPLQGPPAILVFDRMQHLFDVDSINFAVRLRREGEPFSATIYTSPVPQSVRYFSTAYLSAVHIDRLTDQMPQYVTNEIFTTFGSVKGFIAAHRLYVFVQDGGLVFTPSIMTMGQGARSVKDVRSKDLDFLKSPQKCAERIHAALPLNRYVDYLSWARKQNFPQGLIQMVDSPEPAVFLNKFPKLFNVCYAIGNCNVLFGRSDIPLPKYIWPTCLSVDDCLKQLAWASLGGNNEPVIFNEMSREARMTTRAFGGMELLCRQIPQWFEVNNRAGITGQCFITYIGHLKDSEKKAAAAEAAKKAAQAEGQSATQPAGGRRAMIVNKRSSK